MDIRKAWYTAQVALEKPGDPIATAAVRCPLPDARACSSLTSPAVMDHRARVP